MTPNFTWSSFCVNAPHTTSHHNEKILTVTIIIYLIKLIAPVCIILTNQFFASSDKMSSSQQCSHYGLSHALEIDDKSTNAAATSTTGKCKTAKKLLQRRACSESWSFSSLRKGKLGIAAEHATEYVCDGKVNSGSSSNCTFDSCNDSLIIFCTNAPPTCQ